MENLAAIAQIQSFTALGVGLIFGLGALGTAIGFALFFTFANTFVTSFLATTSGAQ